MVALVSCEELAAEFYHRWHVQVVPVDATVIYAPEAAIQTATQLKHYAVRMLSQEVSCDGI